MESLNGKTPAFSNPLPNRSRNDAEALKLEIDETLKKLDALELRLNKLEKFSSITNNQPAGLKEVEEQLREPAADKRMEELIRQFRILLRQLTQHECAWPFMEPLDVKGLGLHDCNEVSHQPMGFSTIKDVMEAKDGTGYKNVREICTHVRLVLRNAMKSYAETSKYHVMAKTLLEKFEEMWLQFLPKVTEEERRREEEESTAQLDIQRAQADVHSKMARYMETELHEDAAQRNNFGEMVVQNSRIRSTEDKRELGEAFTRLSTGDLTKAPEMIRRNNPGFQATSEELDINIDSQTESTLWKLKFFTRNGLQAQVKTACSSTENDNDIKSAKKNERKREISDAITETGGKRSRKHSS